MQLVHVDDFNVFDKHFSDQMTWVAGLFFWKKKKKT